MDAKRYVTRADVVAIRNRFPASTDWAADMLAKSEDIALCNTLERAVELLQKASPFIGGWNGYESVRNEIESFLFDYNGHPRPATGD